MQGCREAKHSRTRADRGSKSNSDVGIRRLNDAACMPHSLISTLPLMENVFSAFSLFSCSISQFASSPGRE